MLRRENRSRLSLAVAMGGFACASLWAQPVGEPPLAVTGALVDEGGSPVAGIDVVLRPCPSEHQVDLDLLGFSDALPGAVNRTRSGPDGAFSLIAPLPGPYRLELRPPAPPGQPNVALPFLYLDLAPLLEDRSLGLLELPRRHPLAIRVLDADERPVQGARVVAGPWADGRARDSIGSSTEGRRSIDLDIHAAASTTNDEGAARFLMPTSSARVVVSAPGFVVRQATAESRETTVRLERSKGLRFRVAGPYGKPAPWVVVRTAGGLQAPLAVTDDWGTATVGRLVGAPTGYEFERADQALARVDHPARNADDRDGATSFVDVRLDAPLRVVGRAFDASTGSSVENAAVWPRETPGHNAISGPRGAFELTTRPRPGALAFQTVAPGYLPARFDSETPERATQLEVVVALTPAANLAGRVIDSRGDPVASATVTALGSSAERPERTATSDAGGRFRLGGLSRDLVRLRVRADGYPPVAVFAVRPGADEPLVIELSVGALLTGRVTDDAGAPVAAASVWLLPDPENRDQAFAWNPRDHATQTDGEGRFRFEHVAPGRWSLDARNGKSRASAAGIELRAGWERRVDLQFGEQAALSITVTDDWSRPVAEASIRVAFADRPLATVLGSTDAAGQAHVAVDVGAATVHVTHRLYRKESTSVELAPGVNDLSIRLLAGGTIRGYVRSSDQVPLSRATVQAQMDTSLNVPAFARRYLGLAAEADTDLNGRFEITGLEPGRYVVSARAAGFAANAVDRTIEIAGQSTVDVDIVLAPGVSITGVVTGLEPSRLVDVEISAARFGERETTSPDHAGAFALSNLAPGEWTVTATSGDFAGPRTVKRAVTILDAAEDTFVELPFERGLRFSGQVLAAGEPLVGGLLSAVRTGSEEVRATVTDHRGRFEMEGLAVGAYELTIRWRTGAIERRFVDLSADLQGLMIDLQPPATIAGVVIDAVTGQEIVDASLTAGDPAALAGLAADASTFSPAIAGYAFSTAGGGFRLEIGPNASQLLVSRHGYANALLPLSILPGQHLTGLVVELQPRPSETPSQ